MRLYSPLTAGTRVALVAPAGPLKPGDLDRAIANCKTLGWEPVVGTYADAKQDYFAGPDELRASDFNKAIRDDSVGAIWCLRGGYGAMRIMEALDYAALKKHPKAIIGFSDITALHSAVALKADLCSIHGPTARGALTPFSEKSLRAATSRKDQPAGVAPNAVTLVKGKARGRLVGGNLSLLSAMHGTPWQPIYDGSILVLEDVNEAPYRIERMLLQLRLSGDLQKCAGIAFGQFTNPAEDASIGGTTRTIADVVAEAARICKVPAIAGIPLGHIEEQWSLPLGADAELDADEKRLTVLAL
ncbi:MAG TPA: LD-carboxypeptidase [Gemmatimonadaceae bacterium]